MMPLWSRWNSRQPYGWKPSFHFHWTAWFNPFVVLLALLPSATLAQPSMARHAVVRVSIPEGNGRFSGGSATVVLTEPGRTILTSAAHMFPGNYRARKFTIDAPAPLSGEKVSANLRCIDVDQANDLALLQMDCGPLPYCCPVAPLGAAYSKQCLSVGYDETKLPPQYRPATIVGQDAGRTYTTQRPWHGRSGGGLIDEVNGWLVGVVSGYDGPRVRTEVVPGTHGIYAGHQAIVALLRRNGIDPGGDAQAPAPQQRQQHQQQPHRDPYSRPFRQPLPGGT